METRAGPRHSHRRLLQADARGVGELIVRIKSARSHLLTSFAYARARLTAPMKASIFSRSNLPKASAEVFSDELTITPSATFTTSAKFVSLTPPPTRMGTWADTLRATARYSSVCW